jgi:DNA-binding MarR family transcriptional regulator
MSQTSAPSHPVTATQIAAWRAFLDAHARTIEVLTRELRDAKKLPLTWYDVLVQLSEAPDGQLRMQDLSNAIVLSKSGLTRLIDRMEREGLVCRSACTQDKRGTFAEITPAGMATLSAAAPTHLAGVAEHFVSLFTNDEIDTLKNLLGRVADANSPFSDCEPCD